MGRQPEVRRVLVPGHVTRVAAVLGEDGRAEEHDVRSDQVLDRVEDARIASELDQPREREVALDLERPIGVVAGGAFVGLEARAARGRFLRRQRIARIAVAVRAKLGDLRVGQVLAHLAPPTPCVSRKA